ncbi:hypothetical protein PP742_gp46 [Alcaligenes phage vB_Af_QDWS595]|uniref:Uncharacterized protein n=1 Tax=Alcaligenes phage vB_Af_QDWS595 TaxID=2877946 RepID=A0AAE8Y1D3_9CAUD|nr:hypothetical protein PP742_gp46 [Alcaligenes phage vB_Af_QDWS595]UCR75530.1 hypothetical protein vBAfaPQDWS595_46 [Alcaligenes phage vB_Af_QDWS595]
MNLKVCSYSIHDDAPRFHRTITTKGFWLIEIEVTNGIEQIEIEIRNKTKCRFGGIKDHLFNQFTEAMAELSPITNGGFTAYFVKK